MDRNRIIESNKAIKELSNNGYNCQGFCFKTNKLWFENNGKLYSFSNSIIAKKQLLNI